MTIEQKAQRAEVAAQHSHIGNRESTEDKSHTTHPDAQWFSGHCWGVFFHFGISSVLGTCDLSWGMMKRDGDFRGQQLKNYGFAAVQSTITPARYWAQAEKFKPTDCDPNEWISALRSAGGTYAVLTTKHHDGFALWPSKFGNFNTTTYAGGIDLVGRFVEACRRHGIKVGLYYSPPDWYFNRHRMSFAYNKNLFLDIHHQQMEAPQFSAHEEALHNEQFKKYIHGQVTELLTRYGTIDQLWFDGHAHDAISLEEIRRIQPGIIINRRGHGTGDFDTPECSFPKTRPEGWWEYCHILNDGAWGYLKHEIYKPTGWMLSEMAKAASWGGNFLINMAPDSHGRLPTVAYARMKETGAWLSHSGNSLAQPAPEFWLEHCNLPVTKGDNRLYVHALYDFDSQIVLSGITKPRSVRLLKTGETLAFEFDGSTLRLTIPCDLRTDLVDVVEIALD